MARFHMFRIRVERPDQTEAWDDHADEAWQVIQAALLEAPEAETGRSQHWHVGNFDQLEESGVYFKLGRVSPATSEKWDRESHSFLPDEAEDTRTTDVLFDLGLQVGGIVGNPQIARTPKALLRRLEAILENSAQTRVRGYGFVVQELRDPKEFLDRINEAYTVTRFTFMTHRPNFADEAEFTDALQRWGEDMNGRNVQATVSGHDLDTQVIENQTRHALAGGGDVSAQIRVTQGSRPRTIRPGVNPIVVEGPDGSPDDRSKSLKEIRYRYHQLREEGSDE